MLFITVLNFPTQLCVLFYNMVVIFLVEFIQVTLVRETIQFSSVHTTQQNITCILHHAPISQSQVYFHSFYPPVAHLHLPPPLSLWPSPHCCLCLCVIIYIYMLCFFCLISSPSVSQFPKPLSPDSCQSVPYIHASISILSVSLSCLLDSMYVLD